MTGERADAARNREKILSAASEIVATRGIEGLTMANVAAASGVGVGTLYRRFVDRSGLAHALIDARERELQQAFMAGPPPLGPGAPTGERIRAFLHALTDRTLAQLDLLLMAETAGPLARFGGAYEAYHQHLTILIGQARADVDASFMADALLAPVAANLVAHREPSAETIKSGLDLMVDGFLAAAEVGPSDAASFSGRRSGGPDSG